MNTSQAAYQITVKTSGQITNVIPYHTRQQAAKYLQKLLATFPEYAAPIFTDLCLMSGVSIPVSKTSYTIKVANNTSQRVDQ